MAKAAGIAIQDGMPPGVTVEASKANGAWEYWVTVPDAMGDTPKPIDETSYKQGGWQISDVKLVGHVRYNVELSIESLKAAEGHGVVMITGSDNVSLLSFDQDSQKYCLKVTPGRSEWLRASVGRDGKITPAAEFKPEPKTIAEIMAATFEKPALGRTPATFDADLEKIVAEALNRESEPAVKASEFGLAPQVGKMLLDGLKEIDAIMQKQAKGYLNVREDIRALIEQAEKPGFPVPPDEAETFANPDKLAEAIAGPPEAAYGRQLMLCLDNLRALRTTQPAGFQLVFSNGAKLVCKRRDFDAPITARIDLPEMPWRLPTLAECQGDPEATRVWNAVHKPPLEWHKTADGLPPITGEGDSRSESEHRVIWIWYPGARRVSSTLAYVMLSWFRDADCTRRPSHWMEAEVPTPPKEFPKPEITAHVDSGLV